MGEKTGKLGKWTKGQSFLNSEIYRDVTLKQHHSPLLFYSVYDCHSGGDTATPATARFCHGATCFSDHSCLTLQCAWATHSAAGKAWCPRPRARAQPQEALADEWVSKHSKDSRFKWPLITALELFWVWGYFCRIPIPRNDGDLLEISCSWWADLKNSHFRSSLGHMCFQKEASSSPTTLAEPHVFQPFKH